MLRLSLLLALAVSAFALDRNGYITDDAKVIDPTSANKLTSLLSEIEGRTGYDMAVVTVKRADGGAQAMADRLLKEWDHGNLGLVILVAVEDGEFAFSHAAGLGDPFTVKYCAELGDQKMMPRFSDGKFGAGLVDAVTAFIDKVPKFAGPQRQVEWFAMEVDDKHVGSMGRSYEKTKEKDLPVWKTTEEGMFRDPSGKELRWSGEYTETADGKPMHSLEKFFAGDTLAFEVEGEVFYDEFRVTRRMGGNEEKKKLAASADLLFPRGLRERIRASKFAAGAKVHFEVFDPHTLGIVSHDVVVGAAESIDVDGTATEGVRLKGAATPGGAEEMVCDKTGALLRLEEPAEKRVFAKTSNEKAVTLPK